MATADYNRADLARVLADLPLSRGDVVFSHSNLGFFGRPDGVTGGKVICEMFIAALFERIGPEGTLVVPTFTYSFPRREIFDVEASASGMGLFAETVRTHPAACRSADPCYSVAALGARAAELTAAAPENSFGERSFFERFLKVGGQVLNFNFDAGSTFLHYVERRLKVPYRFDKSFRGILRERGVERPAVSTIWVRYLSDDCLEAAFEPFDALARREGVFVIRPLGRGEVGLISAKDCLDLVGRTLPTRPWFLTKAEGLGIASPRMVPEDSAPGF